MASAIQPSTEPTGHVVSGCGKTRVALSGQGKPGLSFPPSRLVPRSWPGGQRLPPSFHQSLISRRHSRGMTRDLSVVEQRTKTVMVAQAAVSMLASTKLITKHFEATVGGLARFQQCCSAEVTTSVIESQGLRHFPLTWARPPADKGALGFEIRGANRQPAHPEAVRLQHPNPGPDQVSRVHPDRGRTKTQSQTPRTSIFGLHGA
jgi:hypothetical protein